MDVLPPQRDLVVSFAQVQLGENPAPRQPGSQVMDVTAGVPVQYGLHVELPEITTGPPGAISLLHHMQRRSPVTARAADDSLPLHLTELCLGGLEFGRTQAPILCRHRPTGCLDMVLDPVNDRRQVL